jgi:hypothetical protein
MSKGDEENFPTCRARLQSSREGTERAIAWSSHKRAAKLLSRMRQASLWAVDGWPMAHRSERPGDWLTHNPPAGVTCGQAVSSVGTEASAGPSSHDEGATGADGAAGILVGAEGRACGGERSRCKPGTPAAAARRRTRSSLTAECFGPASANYPALRSVRRGLDGNVWAAALR